MEITAARKKVEDRAASSAELAELAAGHPELVAEIYRHPNAYDDLKVWIETHYPEALRATVAPSNPESVVAVAPNTTEAPAAAKRAIAPGAVNPTVSWWDRPRAALLTSAVIAAAALIIIAIIAGSTVGRITALDAETADAISMPIDSGAPAPTPEPSASVVVSRIPKTCTTLFSAATTAAIQGAGYQLGTSARLNNPAGTSDGTLASLMAGAPRLECTWHPSNTNTAGIETSILEVDAATAASVAARLQALGYASLTELGGVRYFFEKTGSDGVAYGESDMLRDGVWFATRWVQYGPDGYTADMVGQVFG